LRLFRNVDNRAAAIFDPNEEITIVKNVTAFHFARVRYPLQSPREARRAALMLARVKINAPEIDKYANTSTRCDSMRSWLDKASCTAEIGSRERERERER